MFVHRWSQEPGARRHTLVTPQPEMVTARVKPDRRLCCRHHCQPPWIAETTDCHFRHWHVKWDLITEQQWIHVHRQKEFSCFDTSYGYKWHHSLPVDRFGLVSHTDRVDTQFLSSYDSVPVSHCWRLLPYVFNAVGIRCHENSLQYVATSIHCRTSSLLYIYKLVVSIHCKVCATSVDLTLWVFNNLVHTTKYHSTKDCSYWQEIPRTLHRWLTNTPPETPQQTCVDMWTMWLP